MVDKLTRIREKLESGFYGFWVKRWRTTFLVIVLLVVVGVMSVIQIPKESSPNIKFGIIWITTIYQWVNPTDIDSLITEKIETEIKDIKWIKKITSTSMVWVSSIMVELKNETDTNKALVDIKDAVDKVTMPTNVDRPIVTEYSTDNEKMFNVLLYAKKSDYSLAYLKAKARKLKASLDGKWNISKVDIDWTADYILYVMVNKSKAENMWLTISQIAQAINAFNKNQPLGSHEIGDYSYDFRIQWELEDVNWLKNVPISVNGWVIHLKDIAEIKTELKDKNIAMMWWYKNYWNTYVLLSFNKKVWSSILASSAEAKKLIEQELKKQDYAWLKITYVADMADAISQDYKDLANNGLETVILVFLSILLFVGFKESLIWSVTVPLSFFITFIVLQRLWLSLNFLTNFSLIVCFGIAIDATIVVIQWAHEKIRQWFNPRSAVLLSVRDYSVPLISGTATTVIVFLPMLTLPGIMGKFLAYIPITIFITLLASLFISLTLNSALYYKLNKPKLTYEAKAGDFEYMRKEDLELLEIEREGKTEQEETTLPRRERMLDAMANRYSKQVWKIMKSARSRIISILSPIVLLILSFVFLSPFIGFNLFPSGDGDSMNFTLTSKKGTTSDAMEKTIVEVDKILASVPEVKTYYYSIKNNVVSISVELLRKDDRKRDSFQIEKDLNVKLDFLLSKWIKVESAVEAWWPPGWKAVGIKLIADSNEKFATLINVAKDFEKYLRTIPGTKNIAISSSQNPGQFVFRFDNEKLALLWIKPSDLTLELYSVTNGFPAWSLKDKYDNHDIKVQYKEFKENLNPSDVQNITVSTMMWDKVRIWAVSDYKFENAISEISREDTKIIVKVESDLDQWISSTTIQSKLTDFASKFTYPDGISYSVWWENQDNADLIQAMGIAFLVAVFLIFAILVLQFNSYLQATLILYSIVMGLLGANIWLRLTGNAYSLSFMIWFIALTGIVVNHAIVFIDRINVNLGRWLNKYDAIIETWKSRLHPVLLTTIATIVWLISIARQDKFFAGLAYTIMFWLAVATVMTLFVMPAIYHDKEKIIHLVKRSLVPFVIWIGLFGVGLWLLYVVCLMFGLPFWNLSWAAAFVWILFLWYAIWYIITLVKDWHTKGQSFTEKFLGIKITNFDGSLMNKKQSIKRLAVVFGLLLAPFVTGWILWSVVTAIWWPWSTIAGIISMVGFLAYVIYNVYIFWTSEKNQLWHDKICGTIVEEINKEEKD